jgi:SAM-dependent methyltransferase
MNYKEHVNCRICNSDKLICYLDLGNLPLSNNLADSAEDPIHDQKFPLKVLFCPKCNLSQLSIVIPPEEMFGHYVYRSSISQGYKDHCKQMARDLRKKFQLTENSFHIDIAGNDGALLVEFRDVIGCRSLNVDPAENLWEINEDQGIRYFKTFWGIGAAKHLLYTDWPKADLITATNVLAHVDDIREFLMAAKMVLKQTGVLVIECPYLVDFIEKREFDSVYFEHASYISIYPLTIICKELGLTIMSVESFEIHGGSVRITIGFGEEDSSVVDYVYKERQRYGKIERYYQFAEDVHLVINAFKTGLKSLTGSRIAGFAASAKGSTLMNCAGIGSDTIKYIIDDTPEKQNKFSPGTRIPIKDISWLQYYPVDYLVLLSWNFGKECIDRCRKNGYKGKFIYPLTFEIVE